MTEGYKDQFVFQLLLRKKAAEELKKEQERKAAERRRIIEERCGKPKNIEDANEGKISPVFKVLFCRPCTLRRNQNLNSPKILGEKKKEWTPLHNPRWIWVLVARHIKQHFYKKKKTYPVQKYSLSHNTLPTKNNVFFANLLDSIKRVLRDYHERINNLEDAKFDLEYAVKKKDYEVQFHLVARAPRVYKHRQDIYHDYISLKHQHQLPFFWKCLIFY